jgi:dTMP kinase
MEKQSLFIVIEGLDGSGKTSVCRQLSYILDIEYKDKIKLTFEPHDPSCAGLYIRQVLMKKIKAFSPRGLALAFAANRLDHCERVMKPWLEGDDARLILSDRYYLSSLVYQSSEDFSFEDVYKLNEKARKPDIIFFLNVSNKVCYERMKIRNQPEELFENNLSKTREKYFKAIEYLRNKNNDHIVMIDGDGTIDMVVQQILNGINNSFPAWHCPQINKQNLPPQLTASKEKTTIKIGDVVKDLAAMNNSETKSKADVLKEINLKFDNFDSRDLSTLFLDYIDKQSIIIKNKLSWNQNDAYELEYTMPAGILLRGTALVLQERHSYDIIMKFALDFCKMSDFMLVFIPSETDSISMYYEREKIIFNTGGGDEKLFPSLRIITKNELIQEVIKAVT